MYCRCYFQVRLPGTVFQVLYVWVTESSAIDIHCCSAAWIECVFPKAFDSQKQHLNFIRHFKGLLIWLGFLICSTPLRKVFVVPVLFACFCKLRSHVGQELISRTSQLKSNWPSETKLKMLVQQRTHTSGLFQFKHFSPFTSTRPHEAVESLCTCFITLPNYSAENLVITCNYFWPFKQRPHANSQNFIVPQPR